MYEASSATFPHFIYGKSTHCDSKIKNCPLVSFMLPSITIHFIVNKTLKTKDLLGIDFSQKMTLSRKGHYRPR